MYQPLCQGWSSSHSLVPWKHPMIHMQWCCYRPDDLQTYSSLHSQLLGLLYYRRAVPSLYFARSCMELQAGVKAFIGHQSNSRLVSARCGQVMLVHIWARSASPHSRPDSRVVDINGTGKQPSVIGKLEHICATSRCHWRRLVTS